MSGSRRSGVRGHRLQRTRAVPADMQRRQRATRSPKPVRVTRADGSVEMRAPDSFRRKARGARATAGD